MFLEAAVGSITMFLLSAGVTVRLRYDEVSFQGNWRAKGHGSKLPPKRRPINLVEGPNFGFLVRNATGSALLGTNSHIKRQFVDHLDEGQTVTVHWEFENILNDGSYSVEPAIVYNGSVTAIGGKRLLG